MTYIRWGLANVCEGRIYANKNLNQPEWRKFKQRLLTHEQEHQPGPYNIQDLKHDLKPTGIDLEALIFLAQHPLAWLQFSPLKLYPGKKKLYIDRHLLLLYTALFITVTLAWTIF